MKNPNQYSGKNPIPGPKPFGLHKNGAARVAPAANDESAARVDPKAADDAAARAAVAITSIDAKVDAGPDSNVVTGAAAKADALENVKSGAQILADTARAPASSLPKS